MPGSVDLRLGYLVMAAKAMDKNFAVRRQFLSANGTPGVAPSVRGQLMRRNEICRLPSQTVNTQSEYYGAALTYEFEVRSAVQ